MRYRGLVLLVSALVVLCLGCKKEEGEETMTETAKPVTKSVVMVIASQNFRDEELFKTQEVLEQHGARVIVASSSLDTSKGMLGGTCKPDMPVKDVNVTDYDAVVFIGGKGAQEYWDDETAHLIAQAAVNQDKVLGAICIAPVTLARAGVLRGKKATVFPSVAQRLQAEGAVYVKVPVQEDGKIITADGPTSAEGFGEALARALGI